MSISISFRSDSGCSCRRHYHSVCSEMESCSGWSCRPSLPSQRVVLEIVRTGRLLGGEDPFQADQDGQVLIQIDFLFFRIHPVVPPVGSERLPAFLSRCPVFLGSFCRCYSLLEENDLSCPVPQALPVVG